MMRVLCGRRWVLILGEERGGTRGSVDLIRVVCSGLCVVSVLFFGSWGCGGAAAHAEAIRRRAVKAHTTRRDNAF